MPEIVGVLCGGVGVEREVSLRSGHAVADALTRKGFMVEFFDVTQENVRDLSSKTWVAAFLALHGPMGEDGAIQGMLEWLGIPYTGSGIKASAVGMDKFLTGEIARHVGLTLPKTEVWTLRDLDGERRTRLPMPVIVKPCHLGSSVGLEIVESALGMNAAFAAVLAHDERALAQEFIGGREIHAGLLDKRVLGLVEVVPEGKAFGFDDKYGGKKTQYIVDPQLPAQVKQRIEDDARAICKAIGTEGPARVDFRLNDVGAPVLLEVNTLPGMTDRSLLPKVAQLAGLTFDDLVEEILIGARLKAL